MAKPSSVSTSIPAPLATLQPVLPGAAPLGATAPERGQRPGAPGPALGGGGR